MDINRFDTDAEYSHEYSNFPQKVITPTVYKDIDDSVGATVNEIKRLRAVNDFATATKRIRENIEKLKQYFISATDINRFVEELRNTQIFALKKRKLVYVDSEQPEAEFEGDVWLDINNDTENPDENEELVQEVNKTIEEYKREVEELSNTHLSQEDAIRYGNLLNQTEVDRESLIRLLRKNGVEITNNDSTIRTLINNIDNVRADGNLLPNSNIDPRKYVPSDYSWYAGGTKYEGTGSDKGAATLNPTENGTAHLDAGFYSGIDIDYSGVFNAGKNAVSLKVEKIGSVGYDLSASTSMGGIFEYTLPESYRNKGISAENFFVIPTVIHIGGISYGTKDPQPTSLTNIYNVSASGVAFEKTFSNNKLTITNKSTTVKTKGGQTLATSYASCDIYLVYLQK